MKEVLTWIMSNWEIPAAVVTFIASFLVPGARKIWPIIFRALVTKKAIIQAIIYLMDWVVDSTKTNIDNTLWKAPRKALFNEIAK